MTYQVAAALDVAALEATVQGEAALQVDPLGVRRDPWTLWTLLRPRQKKLWLCMRGVNEVHIRACPVRSRP